MSEAAKRLQRIEEIFHKARPFDTEARGRYLAEACAGDDPLRGEVEALLRRADLETDPGRLKADVEQTLNVADRTEITPDQMIGPYRALRKLGEGGMGEVWLAEQSETIRRRVALKVIKLGMDTRQVVARFHNERQALALMEHPSIASVFDAGSTPSGRPYFVMEYVDGPSITEYCDRRRLTTRERLALFLDVCEGTQHAHQKAVIHRDLKPSNVLVTEQSGKALPKIIDFGVAKAMGRSLSGQTTHTQLGMRIGTPAYMSPEQADPESYDIDTRSDVYALGVLLYELLTGVLPFEMKEPNEPSLETILRRIREEPPTRPSARLTDPGGATDESARLRRTTLSSLRREVAGDLDWIVLKALEKEPHRRYGSVTELREDVGRFLKNQAVLATPPSMTYRARKFVRRHTPAVVVTGMALLFLVTFAVTMAIQNQRIAHERDRANRGVEVKTKVTDFMKELFKVSDPSESRGNSITARELLDAGVDKIEQLDDGMVRAELAAVMGEVYKNLGLFDDSERLLAHTLEGYKGALGEAHRDTINAWVNVANVYWGQGRFDEAESIYTQALELHRNGFGEEDPGTLLVMNNLALLLQSTDRFEESERLYETALAGRLQVLGPEHRHTLGTMRNLASLYSDLGRYVDSESLNLEALEIQERVHGKDHQDTLRLRNNLAVLFLRQERLDDAEPLLIENIEIQKRVVGPDHPDTLSMIATLSDVYAEQGRYDRAEPLILESLEKQRRTLEPGHPNSLRSMGSLAELYVDQGRLGEAEQVLLEAVEIQKQTADQPTLDGGKRLSKLACLYRDTSRHDEAGRYFEQAEEALGAVVGSEHVAVAENLEAWAVLLRKTGRETEAAGLEARAAAIRNESS